MSQPHKSFEFKDIGFLSYFLGLRIDIASKGLFVYQTKHVIDLFTKFNIFDCKPCKNARFFSQHLTSFNSPLLLDPTHYQSLMVALQYLTITRPDLSYPI